MLVRYFTHTIKAAAQRSCSKKLTHWEHPTRGTVSSAPLPCSAHVQSGAGGGAPTVQETLSPGMTISMSAQRANTNPACCQSDSDLTVCLAVWCAPTLSAACLVDSIGRRICKKATSRAAGSRALARAVVCAGALVCCGGRNWGVCDACMGCGAPAGSFMLPGQGRIISRPRLKKWPLSPPGIPGVVRVFMMPGTLRSGMTPH